MATFTIFGLGFAAYILVGFGIIFGGYTATIGVDAVPVIGTFTESIAAPPATRSSGPLQRRDRRRVRRLGQLGARPSARW